MTLDLDLSIERTRSALSTLSTVGAPVAGAAVGALIAPALRPIVWIVLAVGLASHLIGMVGVRRFLAGRGYHAPARQHAAYWLCWAAIGALLLFLLWSALR